MHFLNLFKLQSHFLFNKKKRSLPPSRHECCKLQTDMLNEDVQYR